MGDADLWEMLKGAGIAPDSATAIVQSHRGMGDADLWERLVQNGASKDAAANIVKARGGAADDGSSLSLGNMARVAGLGATFGLAKSTAIPANMRIDAAKADAFKNAHPLGSFALKLLGGMAAPVAAAAAAPELATLGGTMALGGAAGALDAAGEDSDKDLAVGERAKRVGIGAGLGTAGGAAGYGASKLIGSTVSAVLDRVHPERVLAREASKIVQPADLARMNAANDVAPGSASLATSTLPEQITARAQPPRFASTARGVGAADDRGMGAEAHLVAQKDAIDAGKRAIGAQMDQVQPNVNVTPRLRNVLRMVGDVLGDEKTPKLPDADFRLVTAATPDEEIMLHHAYTPETAQSPNPDLRTAVKNFWDKQTAAYVRNPGNLTVEQKMARGALDRHITENVVSPSLRGAPSEVPAQTVVKPGTPAVTEPETADTQVLRDALGRLRYLARNADKRGTDMNGPTAYEIKSARNALQDYLYKNVDGLKTLDGNYAKVMEQQRGLEQIARTAQRSIERHSAAASAGADAGSVGGTLLKGKLNIAKQIMGMVTGGKTNSVMSPKMASAVSDYLLAPGDATMYDRLLAAGKPFSPRIQQSANAATTAVPPALRSLLKLYPAGSQR